MMSLATLALIAAIAAPQIEISKDVVFRKVGGEQVSLDFYRPAGKKTVPLVVVIHGGGWTGGSRADMTALSKAIAEKGMAAANVDYRLAPAFRWPAMLDDVQSAVRFMRTNARKYLIDPKRVGSAGASAGGHLALLLGLRETRDAQGYLPRQSSRVKAVFNIFGPTDLSLFDPTIADFLCRQVVGKPFADSADIVRDFSPIHFVGADSPPIFTLQGRADPLVPFSQAERLDAAMRRAGREHVLRLLPNMGHNIEMSKPDQAKGVLDGIQFLATKLG